MLDIDESSWLFYTKLSVYMLDEFEASVRLNVEFSSEKFIKKNTKFDWTLDKYVASLRSH